MTAAIAIVDIVLASLLLSGGSAIARYGVMPPVVMFVLALFIAALGGSAALLLIGGAR